MARQVGMFDVEERLLGLSKKGDDLERLGAVIDCEVFRPELERAVPRADRSKGGRPPFDHVLMCRVWSHRCTRAMVVSQRWSWTRMPSLAGS
jgi:IS5 family transposase